MTPLKRVLLGSVLALSTLPASFARDESCVRIFLSQARPTASWNGILDTEFGPVPTKIEATETTGISVAFEYRAGKRVGTEFGIAYHDFDFDLSVPGASGPFGSAPALPLWFGLNFHFGNEKVDFYVGPLVHLTFWGNLEGPAGSAETDAEGGLGGVAGLDVRFGKSGWHFNAAARYMRVGAGDESLKVDVDPLYVEGGVGYRW